MSARRLILDRAESYSRDARTFQEMGDHVAAAMYWGIARELREVAGLVAEGEAA